MSGTSWKAKGQSKPLDKAYVKKKRAEFNLEHDVKKSKYYRSEFLARRAARSKKKLPDFSLR
jgi:hypothetical protein